MLVNMHVSEHDMLFSDEPTLRVDNPERSKMKPVQPNFNLLQRFNDSKVR